MLGEIGYKWENGNIRTHLFICTSTSMFHSRNNETNAFETNDNFPLEIRVF